jgi:hypothetical protein
MLDKNVSFISLEFCFVISSSIFSWPDDLFLVYGQSNCHTMLRRKSD